MEPTVLLGEHVIVDDSFYRARAPERGDIVAYTLASDPRTTLLKRIVGLPFETIEIRHKFVFVNAQRIGESYVEHRDAADYTGTSKAEPFKSRDSFGPVKLGMEQYFVLGDNRDQSRDSRYDGPIRRGQIIGKVVIIKGSKRFRQLN